MVDVTADVNHVLYFVLAIKPCCIKCIAAMGKLVFHCVSQLKSRQVCKVKQKIHDKYHRFPSFFKMTPSVFTQLYAKQRSLTADCSDRL